MPIFRSRFPRYSENERSCGCDQMAIDRGRFDKWTGGCAKKLLVYFAEVDLPGLTYEETQEAFRVALKHLNRASGLQLHETTNESEANIRAYNRRLSRTTLAWSGFPTVCDTDRDHVEEAYDISNRTWDFELLVWTVEHEIGHALGEDHVNDTREIMHRSIQTFENFEITPIFKRRLQAKYGDPPASPHDPTGQEEPTPSPEPVPLSAIHVPCIVEVKTGHSAGKQFVLAERGIA